MPSPPLSSPPRAEPLTAPVWTLLLCSSVAYFFSINEADNDLWGHLFAGREILAHGGVFRTDTYAYTTAGGPWVNHEWLTHVMFAALYGLAGAPALLGLKLGLAVLIFGLLFRSIRARTSSADVAGAMGLLCIAVLARGLAIRPQLFTYAGIALVLVVLDAYAHGRRWVVWIFPPLFALWVNVHGGFVLGLAIVGLFAATSLLVSPQPSAQPLLAWAASALATLLNPYGPALLRYLWDELSRAHPITEWQPATPLAFEHSAFFAMLALFIATLLFARRWREDGWHTLLALGVGVAAVRHQRHAPVFALCAAAPLTAQVDAARHWLKQRTAFALSLAARRIIGVALVGLASLQLTFTGLRWWRDGLQIVFDPDEYPTAAVRTLRDAHAHGNLAVPLDWGAYVLWFLAPQIKPSLDGRFATVFPEAVVEDNFEFFRGDEHWRRLLDHYPTEAVLVPAGSPCPIAREPGWARVYADRVAEIYVRADRVEAFQLKDASAAAATRFFP